MQHFAFMNTEQLEEIANRPCNFLSTPPKEYNKIIQAKAEVLIRNVRLQPIQERHHGFLSTLAEAGKRNVKYKERDNRFDFSRAYKLHLAGVRLLSFSNVTLKRL